MAFASSVVRRSTSKFASVCGGRVRSISAVVNRPSLALNPSPVRPFVSSSFLHSTAVDQMSSEQTLRRMIDFNINSASQLNDIDNDEETTPGIFPFRIEDDGGETVILTRDYKGEHIVVVVGMPSPVKHETDHATHEYDESIYMRNIDDDDECNDDEELCIPLTVNVTKKSGLSLKFRCTVFDDNEIDIDGVYVNHSADSSEDQLANEGSGFENLDYDLQTAFYKYLETRLKTSTRYLLYEYMVGDRKHLLWLKDIKKFLDE